MNAAMRALGLADALEAETEPPTGAAAALLRGGLVEQDGLVLLASQEAYGTEHLDRVGREAFHNHVHISGPDALMETARYVHALARLLGGHDGLFVVAVGWDPAAGEASVRFHRARSGEPGWLAEDLERYAEPVLEFGVRDGRFT